MFLLQNLQDLFFQGDDGGDRQHAQLDQGADHDQVEIANT